MSLKVSTTDPIADLLTRLRNAAAVGATSVQVPASAPKLQLLKVLKQAGYIDDFKDLKDTLPTLLVTLAPADQPSRLNSLKRVSKPGRRVYVKAAEIPVVRQGQGLAIVSTSQGLMAGHVAKARKLGGELICEVY